MQQEFGLQAVSHTVIGIVLVTLLVLLIISHRKEMHRGFPLPVIVFFGFFMIGICSFISLMAMQAQTRKMIYPNLIFHRPNIVVLDQSDRTAR